jgi:hypothetical protein
MPTPGFPGTPRPTAGRPTEQKALDALLTRLERHIARLERAEERDAAAVRFLNIRLTILARRLAALDSAA